ncbi:MAG: YetF domain-containing protein, partial [Nitriliruptor sp.]
QMSAFDFVATVAVGSIIASVGLGSVPLVDGLVAVTTLFTAQYVTGRVRRRRTLKGVIDNTPLLLLRDGEVLEDHLREARFTVEDLRSHLRRSNVDDLADVRAVVLETTGDVSVLYGSGNVDPLLQGVRGAEGHEGPTGQLSGG